MSKNPNVINSYCSDDKHGLPLSISPPSLERKEVYIKQVHAKGMLSEHCGTSLKVL